MATENGVLIRKHPQRPPPPQDEGWSWMIVLGVFIYAFFMVGIAKSYGLFLWEFSAQFGVTYAVASMPLSISGVVYAFGAPAALIIAEKYDARRVVIFGAIVGMIGIAISSALVSMGFVTFFFGVWYGIGNSCFYGNGLVMIGKYFRRRRSVATGVGLAGASIGQFAMPPIIQFLLKTYGLSGTLLVLAGLYLNAAVSGALFRPLSDYGPPVKPPVPQPKQDAEDQADDSDKKTDGETKVFVKIQDEPADVEIDDGDGTAFDEHGQRASSSSPVSANGKVAVTNGAVSFSTTDETQPLKEDEDLAANNNSLKHGEAETSFLLTEKETEKTAENDGEVEEEEEDHDVQTQDERKMMLASTGSVFLVSPTVKDIKDVDENAHVVSPNSPSPAQRRHDKRKELCNRINNVFDFRVLRSYVTLFYTANCFFCFFGYFSHILFLPGAVMEKGITDYRKALLISMCGAGDLISRVSTGFFADMNIIPRYRISATACILCGLNIILTLPANNFYWLAVHCFLYGYFGGAYVSLLSVVLVDMVGLALMSKNLAVIMLIQGIGSAVGQVFLGWVRDETGSYDFILIISFVNTVFGGIMLFFYPVVRKWEDARLTRSGKLV